MRSYVSVDPTQTPYAASSRSDRSDGYFPSGTRRTGSQSHEMPNASRFNDDATEPCSPRDSRKGSGGTGGFSGFRPSGGQAYQVTSENVSGKSENIRESRSGTHAGSVGSGRSSFKEVEDNGAGLLTARFKHVITEDGHAVITGRDGETLQRCEDEPIHIPGAVQAFGGLIALQEEADGKLLVRIVSENCKRIIGYSPRQLFSLESFTDILSEEQADNLLDHIDFIKDEAADVETNGPEVFTLTIRNAQRRPQKLWCALHMNDKNPDLIICEFELEEDPQYPLVPLNNETPEPPEDTLSSAPTADELRESTENRSKPLRVLRNARKRRGEAAAMEVFNIMSQVQEQLADAPNLTEFLKVLVGVVKELTGFHRVMIYQFDQQWNGKVVTELVDPRATKDLYKGLHFPASDIPQQAREMYRINRVRLLYDRDLETARLVCRTVEDIQTPLDLTHSYLRAMSPIHIKYLANMGVRSSMSISINAFNELWGLISCHAYGGKGTRVSFPIRKMCRLVGDSASRNIERLSYASRLQARKLINTAPSAKNPSGYIIASSDDLLKLFDADFGLLSIHDETKILGKLEGTQEPLALLEYLRLRKLNSVISSQDIKQDFPDLRYPPGFQVIAGLLLVPLSVGGGDFIVFFRKGQLREVKWAGNPYEKYVKEGTEGYLEPRKSFKTWSETIVGKCRDWSEEEIETAAVLCLVYGKFIEVWRQKEQALENSQLTKILLANSAHEVRTPLNAIINYLEIALEGTLDHETRDNLAKSHSASKSLIYVINDLLDLTKTEEGTALKLEEAFDLRAIFRDATLPFEGEAKRKNITYEIRPLPQQLPEKVLGDQRRVRQAISNILANAVEATKEGSVSVEMIIIGSNETHIDVEVVIEDSGAGMSGETLDALFADLEQAQSENDTWIEESIAGSTKSLTEKNKRVLGLGLATVARIVRNMDGQLRLKSEQGKGSRFIVQFPFDLPESEPNRVGSSMTSEATLILDTPKTATEGEVLLVARNTETSSRRGSTESLPRLSRRTSGGSTHSVSSTTSRRSLGSMRSAKSTASHTSGKSDVDRLIQALQEPHMIEKPSKRQNSRGHSSRLDTTLRRASRSPSPSSLPMNPVKPRRPSTSTERHGGTNQEMPVRAIKVPDDEGEIISEPTVANRFEEISDKEAAHQSSSSIDGTDTLSRTSASPNADNFCVLVAEDDPINSRIIQKRLDKAGHQTHLTVNGEECASRYCEKPGDFDIILMDMQVSIFCVSLRSIEKY